MNYLDDIFGPKKKGKNSYENSSIWPGMNTNPFLSSMKEQPSKGIDDMYNNFQANYGELKKGYQTMKASPVGQKVGKKIKKYKEKKSMQARKKQAFFDNLRTKKMKKRALEPKDYFR